MDQVIALSKELASIHTQIEALNARRANLRRRIDTDLLTINFTLPRAAQVAELTPVMDALRSARADFKLAVGQVITFLAMLLPWLVIIVPGVVLIRIFWRWMSRWLVRRESRA